MTPDRIKEIRKSLGLSQAGLAKALRMADSGARTVRLWETGKRGITGPASVALEYMRFYGIIEPGTVCISVDLTKSGTSSPDNIPLGEPIIFGQ